jgi:MYXO-CTERM domain-containing protein
MRKTLAVLTAAFALTFGTASVATAAVGSDVAATTTAAVVTTVDNDNDDDNGNWGLWGLAGLLGLAGLAGLRRRPGATPYDAHRDPTVR